MKKEVKARFCSTLQVMEERICEEFIKNVVEGRFPEARGNLDDLDLLTTVASKLKCPE